MKRGDVVRFGGDAGWLDIFKSGSDKYWIEMGDEFIEYPPSINLDREQMCSLRDFLIEELK